MSSVDISRKLFQPAKHYAGAVYQQGRVTLDSDQNENNLLAGEELQRLIAEAICSGGSPNAGFTISNVHLAGPPGEEEGAETYDFDVAAGSFYLGGRRFTAEPGDKFLGQSDWLQITLDGGLPAPPAAGDLANGPRHDFVWLEAWEQCVTATEDSEILERALGGPDTTARLRRMRRIHVTTNTADDCNDALGGLGIAIDPDSGAILSPTRLTVGFDPAGITDDPCKPATKAGFLGADNQTFRVQITAPGRFIWGADNASPLYRVQAQSFEDPGGGPATLRRIHFLTPPPDQAHYPLAGQTVELMRWGALLPNHEKVAEPTGMLATVKASYDPDSGSIVIATAVPQAWVDWFAAAGAGALSDHDQPEDREYFYLRLWTGGSGANGAPDFAFAPNVAQPLAGTGLTVTFSDNGRLGEYWAIAARPNTPDIVVPWALQQGLPPMGPLVFLTPLAIITWALDNNNQPVASVHDCRHRFRPLCETSCCCTITVGDGQTSFGDVASVQTAIELVPDGGEVCVLQGTYRETITIDGRHNITVVGCGPNSLLTPPAENAGAAVLTIRNSSDIELRELGFEALEIHAIAMDGNNAAPVRHTAFERLDIRARDVAAVVGIGLRGFDMRRCDIDVLPLAASFADNPAIGRQPAVYLAGDDLLVEACRVEVEVRVAIARRPPGGIEIAGGAERVLLEDNLVRGGLRRPIDGLQIVGGARRPLGGIQIGGGSHRVRLRDNLIRRGNGHGIILGSVRFVRVNAEGVGGIEGGDLTAVAPLGRGANGGAFVFIGLAVTIDENGCIVIDPQPPGGPGDGGLVPVSEGALVDIAILDNRIETMGASGISVARFFDLSGAVPEYISIEGLEIAHNRIIGCVTLEAPPLPLDLRVHSATGGIALAHCERLAVRDNRIEKCGTNPGDPVCGVFVLFSEGAVVERNRVTDNGTASTETSPPRPGRRGGVVFGLALPGSFPLTIALLNRPGLRQDGAPALRVHDNVIVTPQGRALDVVAVGPVSACDNQFTSRGGARRFRTPPPVLATGAGGFGLRRSAALGLTAVAAQSGDPLLAFIDLLGGLVVAIVNLGVSNELYGQLLGFSGLGVVDRGPAGLAAFNSDEDDLFFGGEVLFDDNQVSLDALAADIQIGVSAVLLLSLDDVGMTSNQCTCDLLLDFILTNALVLGFSLRVTDNRFKEPVGIPGLFTPAFLSAVTLALMNETSLNQGTHCFYAIGAPALSVLTPNRVLIEAFNRDICARFERQSAGAAGHFALGQPA